MPAKLAPLSQAYYFERLQELLADGGYCFVVKQLAILAAMQGRTGEERALAECYERLELLP